MSQLLKARRKVRHRINSFPKYDLFLHRFITVVLTINMILILYALISVTFRMTFSGVGFVDSLPIALYILPMMIILPIMIRAYYRGRTAAWNFVFLTICTVFFSMLSLLVRGFILCLIINLIAAVFLFIMGRFRPMGKLREAGKKVIAYFLLVNLLGLSFPISIIVMGQTSIANVPVDTISQIHLSVPLADFDFPYQNVNPTPQLLSDILSNDFYLDFHVLENNSSSWSRLRTWLLAINETEIIYSITLTADRGSLVGENPQTLASSELIEDLYESHRNALIQLVDVALANVTNEPYYVLFDMTLSKPEWQQLMIRTRNLDLMGFGGLLRASIDSVDEDRIETASALLYGEVDPFFVQSGLLVESFVVDDLLDGDSNVMKLCGVTPSSLRIWSHNSVSLSRSRFSFEMNGDVGEYLVYSYSSSIGGLEGVWKLGEIGNSTDVLGRTDTVYKDLDVLVNDIALALGNGVVRITLDSLPSLLSAFGNDSLSTLRSAIDVVDNGVSTYTFRIYAFRAVFLAIDSFDFIML
ncbi:MAG: hypothetical protein ACFFBL_10315 [Promethearchaeota archaeon]